MIGRLVYGNILIAVDVFSNKKGALKPNETRVIDGGKPLMPQIYEALSGSKWDSFMEKFDKEMEDNDSC